jgi:hypothetical protein
MVFSKILLRKILSNNRDASDPLSHPTEASPPHFVRVNFAQNRRSPSEPYPSRVASDLKPHRLRSPRRPVHHIRGHSASYERTPTGVGLYEAWNKPEKAKEWRAKLPQTEAVEEWHVTIYMATISRFRESDISLKGPDTKMSPHTPIFPKLTGGPHPLKIISQLRRFGIPFCDVLKNIKKSTKP